jgi:hypothetical protein
MHTPVKLAYLDKLLDMEGKLALYSIDHRLTAINVWVMQDYEAEIWTFKFRIDVSTVEASRQLYLTSYKKKKKGITVEASRRPGGAVPSLEAPF